MKRFINSEKFSVVEMPEAEALAVMDEIGAMADSVSTADRMRASDLYNSAGSHRSLSVVERTLETSRWLMSHELYADAHDNQRIEEIDPNDPRATVRLAIDGKEYGLVIPGLDEAPVSVHPVIQKNVVRELAMIGARTEAETKKMSTEAVLMLGIVSMRSIMSSEARLAIGWAGRATPHHDLVDTALGILRGTVSYDASQFLLETDPTKASVMGLYAIGERSDGYSAIRATEAVEEAHHAFPYPEYDQAFASAARRQIGRDSPFTDLPRY